MKGLQERDKNPCDSPEHSIFEPENTKLCLFPAAPCNRLGDHHHPELGLGFQVLKPLLIIFFYIPHLSAPSSLLKDTQGPG